MLAAARQIGVHMPTICFADNGCPPSALCMVLRGQGAADRADGPFLLLAGGRRAGNRIADGCGRGDPPAAVELISATTWAIASALFPELSGPHGNRDHVAAGSRRRLCGGSPPSSGTSPCRQSWACVCHRPCERPCRRKTFDEPVAIGLVERFVADTDLASPSAYLPKKAGPPAVAWQSSVPVRPGFRPPGISCCWAMSAPSSTSGQLAAAVCATSFRRTCCRQRL